MKARLMQFGPYYGILERIKRFSGIHNSSKDIAKVSKQIH